MQDRCLSGRLRVVVATNAFGLGLDKPDVRFVAHRDSPATDLGRADLARLADILEGSGCWRAPGAGCV